MNSPSFVVVYGNKSLVIKNGGVQAAVTSLRTMAHNPDVVGLALKLLGNLIELGNKYLYLYHAKCQTLPMASIASTLTSVSLRSIILKDSNTLEYPMTL